MAGKETTLTPKQQRFVDEYLTDLNATQAAIRAGYSKKTAAEQAARLLVNAKVAAEIDRKRRRVQNKLEVSQEKVIAELMAIAFANGTDYAKVTSDGSVLFKPTDELDPAKRKAIAGIKETNAGMEVKLHDKLRAIELLDKYLNLFEQQKTEEETSLADTIMAAYQRRKGAEDADE